MKFSSFALVAAMAAGEAAAHATFQQFWINGVDQGTTCARVPSSNSPVTDVTSNNMRCNAGTTKAASNCAVKAGDTVTVEMHQQNGDRSCANEAIGGQHYGPVNVYMSKVSNAATADGSTGWFKVFADSWRTSGKAGSSTSDDDFWGTKDLNSCCGKMDLKIPSDIAAGDYLLRAEALALHSASGAGGAQFYMTCFQVTVSGGGSASPATVNFPGAYKATDPGILVNIHYPALSTYVNPGPAVYSGGTTKQAGSACGAGSNSPAPSNPAPAPSSITTAKGTTLQTTTSAKATTTAGGGAGGCSVAKYGQCGGSGYTGCTVCSSGTCTPSGSYYSQCL